MANPPFEILAPAGDETMLRAAVFSGADCVYLGIEGFNARRTAANFAGETLAKAVAFCHARNCKVYAAVNTVVLPGEETKVEEVLRQVAAAGCDAVIVQDFAVAEIAKQVVPQLPLHASTQASVHSLAGVQQMAALGFSRVILSRELAAEEIAAIAAQSPIELEVFVHGALCVSVSGQCYMSAFLGGRSANRGACAGPCRLPFSAAATGQNQPDIAVNPEAHHLSLKDLSVLKALPRLRQMGVVSAKIEGRLRGPEYCAVVVDSARKALAGEVYDEKLLQGVFSRSGFTGGWFNGQITGAMFGTRTGQDTALAKTALPKARELYRREMPRVPVQINLTLNQTGGKIAITDGTHTVQAAVPGPLQPAQQAATEALQTALAKTGGTPFYAAEITLDTGGLFLPGSVAGALRRTLLEELLQKREEPQPLPQNPLLPMAQWPLFAALAALPDTKQAPQKAAALCARLEHVAQLPPQMAAQCDELVLPLFEAEKVPEELRAKTWLWLPRVLFANGEERAAAAIQKTKQMGFKGYEVQNVAHWYLCKGLPMRGGFGLNITNVVSAAQAVVAGCSVVTLSAELTLRQMQRILQAPQLQGKAQFTLLGYGKMPLMITRACPIKNITTCAACQKQGELTDRKGQKMPLLCRDDVRTILNPVPLWMADRLHEVPTGEVTLYFTNETPQQVATVLHGFVARQKAEGLFTRGLYYKGIEE
ncbi:U32 family peptidase [Ruminococcaceae bacterium OttesenSCG-928-A16]|nr:U32 family peptidase [Ruminococcaceae bacterium OttesenSCG-928-A16]